jgi:Cd2+/Zn2+-exporting ATPase
MRQMPESDASSQAVEVLSTCSGASAEGTSAKTLQATRVVSASHSATAAQRSIQTAAGADVELDGQKLPSSKLLLVVCGILALTGTALHIFAGESAAWAASLCSVGASALGMYLIYPEVAEAIKKRRVDINILMVVAVLGALALGDFSEAGVVVFLFCVGEWLEGFAIDRNRRSISALLELTPPQVQVIRQGRTLETSPEQIRVGEIIIVKPGSRIPLDGTITEGTSLIDEAAITGESVPVEKSAGSAVYSGALNVSDFLRIKTSATVEDSTLARIVELVRISQLQRSPYERFINRFARYYTPAVLVAAVLVALVVPSLGMMGLADLGGFDVWVYRALSMLVVACPCALVIATPVSIVCAMARAARSGIIVKGGAFLELAAKIDAIAFDKTGTLTQGAGLNRNELRDELRPEAAEVMDRLKAMHVRHTVMLTGDKQTVAAAIGHKAHVDQVHAELLPEQKLDWLRTLKQKYGHVAMVGDGINDAPALALADVGIAMGALGTDTAIEAADVALMEDSLAGLPRFFKLARKTVATIKINIAFALVIKVIVLALTVVGAASMWVAILADTGVLLAVLLFSMRLLRIRL